MIRRRILLFAACSMGIAVVVALIIAATGGLADSPVIVPGTPVTLAVTLMATVYMFAPTVAHLVVRAATREGWSGVRTLLRVRANWSVWVLAWLGPAVLTAIGAALYFVVSPGAFDPSLEAARSQLAATLPAGAEVPPASLPLLAALASVTVAPFFNAIFAFGEEFGWRGYLQPKLLEFMSPPRALLVMGVIWGVWHWPVIALGYEYGLDYPGAPWVGFLLFPVFTFAVGTLLGWLTVRSGSVLPAALGHGAVNATAGLGLLVTRGGTNPLIGPLPIGIVGVLGYLATALVLLRRWPTSAAGQPSAPRAERAATG